MNGVEIALCIVDGAVFGKDAEVGLEVLGIWDEAFAHHALAEVLCELEGNEAVFEDRLVCVGAQLELAGLHGAQDGDGSISAGDGAGGVAGHCLEEEVEVEGGLGEGKGEEGVEKAAHGDQEVEACEVDHCKDEERAEDVLGRDVEVCVDEMHHGAGGMVGGTDFVSDEV